MFFLPSCAVSGLASFSSADLKFAMTLGRKEGSRQTNLPLLSSVEGSSDIGVDREGKIVDRRPKIKDKSVGGSQSQRCRGENSNKSPSPSVPPDVYVQMIITPLAG